MPNNFKVLTGLIVIVVICLGLGFFLSPLAIATYFFVVGKDEEALPELDKAISQDPKSKIAYYLRGQVYEKLEQYSRAINDDTKVIEIAPISGYDYSQRGDVYTKLEEYQKAIDDYSKAINLQPSCANFYTNRANAYNKMQMPQKAIDDYSKAIILEFKDADYYYRGKTYLALGQYKKAISDYNTIINRDLDSDNPFPYEGRGNAYQQLGQTKRAALDFEHAIKLHAHNLEMFKESGQQGFVAAEIERIKELNNKLKSQ